MAFNQEIENTLREVIASSLNNFDNSSNNKLTVFGVLSAVSIEYLRAIGFKNKDIAATLYAAADEYACKEDK